MEACHSRHIGTAFRQWQVGPFTFGWWWTREFGDSVREHKHDHAHVLYACTGEYRSRALGYGRPGVPIIFNPSGTVHSDRFETPGLFFSLTFAQSPEEIFQTEIPSEPVATSSVAAGPLIARLLSVGADDHADADKLCEWHVAELLMQFGNRQPKSAVSPWLRRVCAALHDAACVPGVTALAYEAGVHPYHLSATFRRVYGCTPGQYARHLRIERALGGLALSKAPIAELAVEYGFSDQSHFTRAVTERFGVGPAEVRRRLS